MLLQVKKNLQGRLFAQGRSSSGFEEGRVGQRPTKRPLAYVRSMILSLLGPNQELPRFRFHHWCSGQLLQQKGGWGCAGADSGDRRRKVRRKPPVHNTQLVRPGMGQGCRLIFEIGKPSADWACLQYRQRWIFWKLFAGQKLPITCFDEKPPCLIWPNTCSSRVP